MNSRADSSLRILQIGAVALLCLHWTAMSIPERLWGVHHLAFLPVPVSLALTLLAFAVALSLHVEACKWVGDRLDVAQRTLCDRSPAGGSHRAPALNNVCILYAFASCPALDADRSVLP